MCFYYLNLTDTYLYRFFNEKVLFEHNLKRQNQLQHQFWP
jgi:hypothetical protein